MSQFSQTLSQVSGVCQTNKSFWHPDLNGPFFRIIEQEPSEVSKIGRNKDKHNLMCTIQIGCFEP